MNGDLNSELPENDTRVLTIGLRRLMWRWFYNLLYNVLVHVVAMCVFPTNYVILDKNIYIVVLFMIGLRTRIATSQQIQNYSANKCTYY